MPAKIELALFETHERSLFITAQRRMPSGRQAGAYGLTLARAFRFLAAVGVTLAMASCSKATETKKEEAPLTKTEPPAQVSAKPEQAKQTASTDQKKGSDALDQVSDECSTAIREARFARVAIFDGRPDTAMDLLTRVQKQLAAAEQEAPKLTVTIKSKQQIGGKDVAVRQESETSDLVPIDVSLEVTEDYGAAPAKPVAQKNAKVQEANQHLKNAESVKAAATLREAGIGVSVSRVLMPLKATIRQIDQAVALLKDSKYYEANLALRDADQGLVVDKDQHYFDVTPNTKVSANDQKK